MKKFRKIDTHRVRRKAFQMVMDAFYEVRSTHGTLSAFDYSTLVNQGGKADCTHKPRAVKPTLSDFLIDVENAAKASLENPKQWEMFKEVFLDCVYADNLETPGSLDAALQEKIGRTFIARRIFPLKNYFQATAA